MKRNKAPPDDATAHEPEDMPRTPDGTTSEDDLEESDPEQVSTQNDSVRAPTGDDAPPMPDGTTVLTPISPPIPPTHQTSKDLKINTRDFTPKSPSHKTPKCFNIRTNTSPTSKPLSRKSTKRRRTIASSNIPDRSDENEPPDLPSPDPDLDEDETDWKKQEWTQKPDPSHPDIPKAQSPKQPPNRTKPPTHLSPPFSDDAPNTTVNQTN